MSTATAEIPDPGYGRQRPISSVGIATFNDVKRPARFGRRSAFGIIGFALEGWSLHRAGRRRAGDKD